MKTPNVEARPCGRTYRTHAARGLSLTEVLISFFILLIGVVSVIALFPVGVQAVQKAVMDTRSTLVGIEANNLVLMSSWPDDPYFWRLPHQGFVGMPAPLDAANPQNADPRGVTTSALPAVNPDYTGSGPSSDLYPPPPGAPTQILPNVNNVYATIPLANGQVPAFPLAVAAAAPDRFHPQAGDGPGFPILVDPALANSTQFQFDTATPANTPHYKRVAITSNFTVSGQGFATMAPFAGALNDLVVHSLSEVQYQPAGLSAVTQRDQYLKQKFASLDLLVMEETMSTAPYNPNRTLSPPTYPTYIPSWRYMKSADSSALNAPASNDPPAANSTSAVFSTMQRSMDYSFAFVVQGRKIHPNPGGFTLPNAGANAGPYLVPRTGEWSSENITTMVFNKRSIGRGYHMVRACFFNGSGVATLSWDPTVVLDPPNITRGMWLMEATISPGLRDTTLAAPAGPAPLPPTSLLSSAFPQTGVSAYTKYRHAIEFHRVASVQDARIGTDGQMYQIVNLEKPVKNYPVGHVLGDGRPLPDLYEDETFSGAEAYPNVLPARSVVAGGGGPSLSNADVNSVWVPVILWHGLIEVFSGTNQ